MKPALYYPWVYLKGGAERLLIELMQRSRHEWTLYTNHFDADATFPEFRRLRLVCLPSVSVRRNVVDVAMAGLRVLTQPMSLREHSALVIVSEGLGNLLALRSRIPTSCICLTPLKVIYDDLTRTRFFSGRLRPAYRLGFWTYRVIEQAGWRRYRRVFCNSNEVRRRLLAAKLVDDGRIEVAYHGVDLDRFRPTGQRSHYLLVPGRIMWQKNIELALAAWQEFKPSPELNDFQLVIAGMVDAKSRAYFERLRAYSASRPDITFQPSPSDSQMLRLYQSAHGVVFPAPNEDWGLVVLEAMACGKPVIAANRGGPRESIIDGQTGFLRMDTRSEFAGAMRELVFMPKAQMDTLSGAARARAEQFSWDRFVERIDTHVEELATKPITELPFRRPVIEGTAATQSVTELN